MGYEVLIIPGLAVALAAGILIGSRKRKTSLKRRPQFSSDTSNGTSSSRAETAAGDFGPRGSMGGGGHDRHSGGDDGGNGSSGDGGGDGGGGGGGGD